MNFVINANLKDSIALDCPEVTALYDQHPTLDPMTTSNSLCPRLPSTSFSHLETSSWAFPSSVSGDYILELADAEVLATLSLTTLTTFYYFFKIYPESNQFP